MSLIVTEIFKSIQGESSYQGLPCTFVRLTGCNLRCKFCDTSYAYDGGTRMTVGEVLDEVGRHGLKLVEITGGEPLMQDDTHRLVDGLIEKSFTVLVETNGTIDLSRLNRKAVKIMDIKCPGSGESDRMNWDNLKLVQKNDEIKFVILDREDYEWAKKILVSHRLNEKAKVLFSSVWDHLAPDALAGWILQDGLDVRLNLQFHKFIWGEVEKK